VAFIQYLNNDEIPEGDKVADSDNILQIHGIHSKMLKLHDNLYRELMYGRSPLSRIQRELIAVVVSAENECHY